LKSINSIFSSSNYDIAMQPARKAMDLHSVGCAVLCHALCAAALLLDLARVATIFFFNF
jgi:hypothetical protein